MLVPIFILDSLHKGQFILRPRPKTRTCSRASTPSSAFLINEDQCVPHNANPTPFIRVYEYMLSLSLSLVIYTYTTVNCNVSNIQNIQYYARGRRQACGRRAQ